MKKLYVGNLSYTTTEDDLKRILAEFGEVQQVTIIRDKYDDRSKGFGFVEMADSESADAAIQALDGSEVDGRSIKVNVAKPRRENNNHRASW